MPSPTAPNASHRPQSPQDSPEPNVIREIYLDAGVALRPHELPDTENTHLFDCKIFKSEPCDCKDACKEKFSIKGWPIPWDDTQEFYDKLVLHWVAIFMHPQYFTLSPGQGWTYIAGKSLQQVGYALLIRPAEALSAPKRYCVDNEALFDGIFRLLEFTTSGGSFVHEGLEIALKPKCELQDMEWMWRCRAREVYQGWADGEYGAGSERAKLEPCKNPSCKYYQSK